MFGLFLKKFINCVKVFFVTFESGYNFVDTVKQFFSLMFVNPYFSLYLVGRLESR